MDGARHISIKIKIGLYFLNGYTFEKKLPNIYAYEIEDQYD